MPWLIAVRVVSLPATTRSRKNEPSSLGVSLCFAVLVFHFGLHQRGRDVVARIVEAVLRNGEAVLEQLHARAHQLFERLHVLGITDAEDLVRELEDALGVGTGDAEHVADDLQRQRGRDLAHEVALAAERRDLIDDVARLLGAHSLRSARSAGA